MCQLAAKEIEHPVKGGREGTPGRHELPICAIHHRAPVMQCIFQTKTSTVVYAERKTSHFQNYFDLMC